ncbi:2,3-bisphosphoglycerate-dependent phosphoglycerate [Musa troglodytarum]|uniref:phosphoglycerate mutase (2,3-diphosphoglycerate-dependent) n=1 Tax=Musa troglodytarum TaxID=320322 RepID=A0A9E7HQX2_9LILI|nr:2,3-bisphosphoglycerate-dependent phosphoglycerate [Musa troglodytarum]
MKKKAERERKALSISLVVKADVISSEFQPEIQALGTTLSSKCVTSFPEAVEGEEMSQIATHRSSCWSSMISARELSDEASLILIRHGESLWNEKNLFPRCVDVPLTQKGVEEAIEAGGILESIDEREEEEEEEEEDCVLAVVLLGAGRWREASFTLNKSQRQTKK